MKPNLAVQIISILSVGVFWLSVMVLLLSPIPRFFNNKERSVLIAFVGLFGIALSSIMAVLGLVLTFDPPASRLLPFAFDWLAHGPAILLNGIGFRSIEYEASYMPITILMIVVSLIFGIASVRQR